MNNIAVLRKLIRSTERHLSSMQDMQHEWMDDHDGVEETDIALSISRATKHLDQLRTKVRQQEQVITGGVGPLMVRLSYSALKYDGKTHYLIEGYQNGRSWSILGTGGLRASPIGHSYEFVGHLLVEQVTGTPEMTDATTLLRTLWCVNEVEITFAVELDPTDHKPPADHDSREEK
jgi:hypothetical protein